MCMSLSYFSKGKLKSFVVACYFTLDRTWKITTDDEDYSYFMEFIEVMANLTLDNFETLTAYEADDRIGNIDLRELVEFVISRII